MTLSIFNFKVLCSESEDSDPSVVTIISSTDTNFFSSLRWQWRQRIRLYLEGTGINPVPVDLHEQQLSQEQHSRAHINERFQDQSRLKSDKDIIILL